MAYINHNVFTNFRNRYDSVDVSIKKKCDVKMETDSIIHIDADVQISKSLTSQLIVTDEIQCGDDTQLMRIGSQKCNHCDNTATISTNEHAICVACINSCVIYGIARQSWIEKNGDPISICMQTINELKKEIIQLRDELNKLKIQSI